MCFLLLSFLMFVAPKRILIVEDDDVARAALAEMLHEDGYIVEIAADGLSALLKLTAFAPDLVLTDYNMPGLDGLRLLRQIRAQMPTLPVILMSAIDTAEGESLFQRARNDGAVGFQEKPIDFDKLIQAIKQALAHSG